MADTDLDTLEALHAKATLQLPMPQPPGVEAREILCECTDEDYDAIAALHNAFPSLAAEIRALRRAIAQAERATRPIVGWVVRVERKGVGGHLRQWPTGRWSASACRSNAHVFATRAEAVERGRWLMPLHKRTLLVVRAPAGKP